MAGTPGAPGNPPVPSYTGPNPAHCLQVVGLTNVRPGAEQGTWIGNFGNTAATDTTSLVLLSGPYGSDQEATQYASSLQTIPELAVAAGRWVASASVRSNLDFQVKAAAQCMAAGAA